MLTGSNSLLGGTAPDTAGQCDSTPPCYCGLSSRARFAPVWNPQGEVDR